VRNSTHSISSESWQRGKTLMVLYWLVQSMVLGIFLYSAFTKLYGTPEARDFFAKIAWGQWLRYSSAALELVGGGLLLGQRTWWVGWVVLMSVAVAAILLRVVTLSTDASFWVQVVAGLTLLASLPRPGVARSLLSPVSTEGAER
jgi:hypothetical protein